MQVQPEGSNTTKNRRVAPGRGDHRNLPDPEASSQHEQFECQISSARFHCKALFVLASLACMHAIGFGFQCFLLLTQ